jgi:hypothetical protein
LQRLPGRILHGMTTIMLIAAFTAIVGNTSACTPVTGVDPSAVLHRAASVTGLSTTKDKVLRVSAFDVVDNAFESDRMYPPFLVAVTRQEEWLDPSTMAARFSSHMTIGGFDFDAGSTLGDARGSYRVRDSVLTPSESEHGSLFQTRPLDVWAVLGEWMVSPDARAEERCVYRDYPRLVLSRRGIYGTERLFIDEKSGYPTKLDRTEPHYLWGQVHVEFVYTTWERLGDAHLPGASFRLEDGRTMIARTVGVRRFVPRDSSPPMVVPARTATMAIAPPAFLEPSRPDTIRVSATTFLLRNPGYIEAVTLARDTVFVFDATQGEERVRQDSSWIGALFPGRHPIVLVVTDLAWPHVAGVRAWVARGATVVSHRASRSFLTSLVNRRWTLQPDLLERRRKVATFRLHVVSDTTPLAGGQVLLIPIDGIASEGALSVYVRPDRFLWASDFIQDLNAPSQYLDEVFAAVLRNGIAPTNVAAEHALLTRWDRLQQLIAR